MRNLFRSFIILISFINFSSANAAETLLTERRMKLVPYSSHAELIKDFNNIGSDLQAADPTPQLAIRAKALVTKLDLAYRKLYPDLMKNKAFPDYIIVKSGSVINDLAFMSDELPHKGTYHGFMVIPDGPLSDSKQLPILSGVLSHEMAHIFLNHHLITETTLKIWRTEFPQTSIDEVTQKAAEDYLSLAGVTGDFIDEHLAGFPVDDSLFLKAFTDFFSGLTSTYKDEKCVGPLLPEANNVLVFTKKDLSYYDWQIHFPNEKEANSVQQSISKFENDLILCSKGIGVTGISLRNMTFKIKDKTLSSEAFFRQVFQQPFKWEDQNEFEVLFKADRILAAKMQDLWKTNNMETLRWKSFEDEADEFAITIMKESKTSPIAFVKALLDYADKQQAGSKAECVKAIRANAAIPFGSFSDPHHSICYRLNTDLEHIKNPSFKAQL